LWGI
jgi:hypothetical protein